VESFEVGVSLVNIGTIYDESGYPDESLKAYEEALSNYRKVLPENHMQIGILLNNIGLTLKGQKRYQEALQKYEEALKIKSAISPESISVASNLSTMGVVYNILGDYDKALECQSKALQIRIDKLGEGHVSVAVSHKKFILIHK
jgi:tetratricopeptide (TPR) repeat protein